MEIKLTLFSLFILLTSLGLAQSNCIETNCCCGSIEYVGIPSGDFEDPPFAAPIIVYWQGETFGNWEVLSGSIDVLNNYLNWGIGNPNGDTQYIDLHGSSVGAIATTLNGLIVGTQYTISVWYAKNTGASSANCQIKVANGAWLSETWTATNNGFDGWLEICFNFIAQGASAELSFTGSGGGQFAGVLLDDITMWTCPADIEPPIINNPPPSPLHLSCEEIVPVPIILNVTDNCPGEIEILVSEIVTTGNCIDGVLRTYTSTDACGNQTSIQEEIIIIDIISPEFTATPTDYITTCGGDILFEFYTWINNNGGGLAIDNCDSNPIWTAEYLQEPDGSCGFTQVDFYVEDFCGNTVSWTAFFVIQDLESPTILFPSIDKTVYCPISPLDSIMEWLEINGGALAFDICEPLFWSHDFNGDITPEEILITFSVADQCGNVSTTSAFFYQIYESETNFIFNESCDSLLVGLDTVSVIIDGCPSLTITSTTLISRDEIFLSQPVCDILLARVDTLFLINVRGCDSLIITNHWFQMPDTTIINLYDCDPVQVGTTVEVVQGMICDSVIITNTYLLSSVTTSVSLTTCEPLNVGLDTLILTNIAGCDSVIITNTYLLYADTTSVFFTTCDSLVAGLDTLFLSNSVGCDSLIIRKTEFQSQYKIEREVLLCEAGVYFRDTIIVNGQGNDCDSVFITQYNFHKPDTTYIQDFSCDQLDTGIYINRFQGVLGCDSTVIQTVIFQGIDTLFLFSESCDSSQVGIVHITSPGLYCDTVKIIQTSWAPFSVSYDTVHNCAGSDITVDTLLFQDVQGCDSIVIRTTLPSLLEADFVSVDESCLGRNDGFIKLVHIEGRFPPFLYALNDQAFNSVSEFSNLPPGVYHIIVKDSAECELKLTPIVVEAGLKFILDIGPDIIANSGDIISLSSMTNSAIQDILWATLDFLSCAACPQTNIGPLSSEQTVRAMAVSAEGCNAEDELQIFLNKPTAGVFIPNSFSPNFDGINDVFTVYGGDDISEVISMLIYDRWGNLLYSNSHFPINESRTGWDGRFKEKLMDPGVFIYVIELAFIDGNTKLYKGEVTLLR
jgi:gliding motility-associated-like protein